MGGLSEKNKHCDYNDFLPHTILDNMTPTEYRKKHFKKLIFSTFTVPAFG